MNVFMFLAPVLLIVGLFGLYDKVRLIRKNGVYPADSRLYRWFALLLILILPVRNFQEQFQWLKISYYILIPLVLIWLFYIQFREGKGYRIIDISESELTTRVEKLLKNHKVKIKKDNQGQNDFSVVYKLGDTEATCVINRTKDVLNETHPFSYTLILKKWWKLPNSEIVIDDLIRKLQTEREPLHLQKQRWAAVGYSIVLIIGLYIAMNTFQ